MYVCSLQATLNLTWKSPRARCNAHQLRRCTKVHNQVAIRGQAHVDGLTTLLKKVRCLAGHRGEFSPLDYGHRVQDIKDQLDMLLLHALEDSKPYIRELAIRGLSQMWPDDRREFIPVLIRMLDDRDRDVRNGAIRALGEIAPNSSRREEIVAAIKAWGRDDPGRKRK